MVLRYVTLEWVATQALLGHTPIYNMLAALGRKTGIRDLGEFNTKGRGVRYAGILWVNQLTGELILLPMGESPNAKVA